MTGERLDGRVLVVTGATRGEAVRRELESLGCEAVFVAAELEDEAACRAVIAACDERFGRLDGLVNAAGLSTRGTLDAVHVAPAQTGASA